MVVQKYIPHFFKSTASKRNIEQQPLYRATHSYAARQSDELTVKAGDTVRITHCESDDWWHAENMETGQAGLVPSNVITSMERLVLLAGCLTLCFSFSKK